MSRKLTTSVEVIILTLVLSNPGIYHREIVREMKTTYNIDLHQSTICGFLTKSGFSQQKMIVGRSDRQLRQLLYGDVYLYEHSMLIFIGETGTDKVEMTCDTVCNYGYSIRGKP